LCVPLKGAIMNDLGATTISYTIQCILPVQTLYSKLLYLWFSSMDWISFLSCLFYVTHNTNWSVPLSIQPHVWFLKSDRVGPGIGQQSAPRHVYVT
jgi:hypothetical protein